MKLFNPQWIVKSSLIVFSALLINACENSASEQSSSISKNEHGSPMEVEIEKGAHGGRLLKQAGFIFELAIFETGVPPEFRAWLSFKGQALKPKEVELKITLIRLGGKEEIINFAPHGDALRGDRVISEPHSFVIKIDANHNGNKFNWQYDTFEGRTKIETAVAKALKIETDVARPIVLQQTLNVFGKIAVNTERMSHVSARFAGIIKSVSVSTGDTVRKGQILASVESNESLKLYNIKAPISGTLIQRNANAGEQATGQDLFVIADTSSVWINLSIFPADQPHIKPGAPVRFALVNDTESFSSKITLINVLAEANQSVNARLVVNNEKGQFLPGSFVKAKIIIAEVPVSLAVKRSGLQVFRDFTVVYAQIGEEYEVRMLELGRQDGEWIEVLGGLEIGTTYVSKNSYVIKADIEKSGASHDH